MDEQQPVASKEKLMADLKVLAGDAEHLLRAKAMQATDSVDELRRRVEENVSAARDKFVNTETALGDRVKNLAQKTDEYVHQHPWTTITVVAGAAFVLGLLIGRR